MTGLSGAEQRAYWPAYSEILAPAIERLDWVGDQFKSDAQLRQELDAFLATINAMVFLKTWYNDPKYPDFWPCYQAAFPVGCDNPDDVYLICAVEDDGVYRLTGHRGTVHILSFEIGSSSMQVWGFGEYGPTLSEYEPDRDLHIATDGTFEVILSSTRPDGHTGNWWELKPGAKYVFVRKRSYDWLGEVDARVAIERLDVPTARPRRSAPEIQRRIASLPVAHENWAKRMLEWFASLEEQGLVNDICNKYAEGGGITSQIYPQGIFDIASDEALILETTVPDDCRYWMFQVTDQMMTTIDQLNRQSSLNGHQARLDSDGRFRAVISIEDPGVPNWLDTGGHSRGSISGRWLSPSSEPQTQLTKVKLFELRDHLPADTPTVTFAEREAILRRRRQGAQLRVRW